MSVSRVVIVPTEGEENYAHLVLGPIMDTYLKVGSWNDFMFNQHKWNPTHVLSSVLFAFPLENNEMFGRVCLVIERRGSVVNSTNTKIFVCRNQTEFEFEITRLEWDGMMLRMTTLIKMLTDPRNSAEKIKIGMFTVEKGTRGIMSVLLASCDRCPESLNNPIILSTDSILLLPKFVPIVEETLEKTFE